MALNAPRPLLFRDCRIILNACRYSRKPLFREDEANKSRYRRDEEGKKPRVIHGEEYPEWRENWTDRKGEWNSKFKLFSSEKNPHPDILNAMQQLPGLNFTMIRNWWVKMKEYHEIDDQRYKSERIEVLGANIGAAHFFLFRKASVRLKGSKTWLKGDPTRDEVPGLPTLYEDGYFIEAIDASTFRNGGLRYEGLENLRNLNFLKWLSLENNSHVDEWGLDRIAGQNTLSLEYLDLRGCKVTVGGIIALARMVALKVLVLTEPQDKRVELAIGELEAEKPHLTIKMEPLSIVQPENSSQLLN